MRDLKIGERVELYWNFHKKLYSVRALGGKDKGRVVAHRDCVALKFVEFKVSDAGRERVRREKRKNVHAVIRGRYAGGVAWAEGRDRSVGVSYNPYRNERFVCRGRNARPIERAKWVECFTGRLSGRPRIQAWR